MDLGGAARARDEELDAQDVAPARHAEHGRHPGPDPLEVVGRADDPDEEDAPGGDGAGGVARDEVPRQGHLVRDADAGGEEHDGAVGVEGLVRAAVGAFDEGGEGDAPVGAVEGFAVEAVGEAGAAADDEGDGGWGSGEGVGGLGGGVGGADAFFEVAGAEGLGRGVGPGDGEGVGGPEADGGDGEEDVLAWFEGPGAGGSQGDAHGVAGEDFDVGVGAAAADVAVDEGGEADETFDDPD